MTRSHRLLNRLLLVLVAVVLFGLAVIAALPLLRLERLPIPRVGAAAALAGTPGRIAIVAVAVVLVVVAIAWIATGGRGRARDVIGHGDLAVDDRVVEGLLRSALSAQSAVVGVHAHGYRQRRRTVYARLDIRRSADLPRLLDDIDHAATEVADQLGTRPPLVVHLTSGLVARATGTRIAR